MQSNIQVLIAQRNQQGGPKVSLRGLAEELGISRYTIYAFANNKLDDLPVDMLEKLCRYFQCGVSDLLVLVDVPDEPTE